MTRTSLALSLLVLAGLMSACSPGDAADGAKGAAEPPEKVIPKALAQRVPQLPPVDEVRPSPVAGLYEVRFGGTEIIYTDAKGDFVLQGALIDTRTMSNLTDARIEQLTAVAWDQLPLKDAMVFKQGDGSRRMAVFADPNCGYCKHLEKELQQIKDVTVYTFMIPILGEDSKVKLDNIWCVKDRTQAWRDWMLAGTPPAKTFGMCASPGQRNYALSQKLRVQGTPAMFFEDGSRLASAAPAATIEQRLNRATAKIGG